MGKPSVSFRMQAYNAEKYIEKSIESILNQTRGDIELILINNASTDGTGEICKRYARRDKRIRYHINEKNTVLNPEYRPERLISNGEYFAYLDSDDYLDPDFVRIMYKKAKKYEADMVVCGTEMFVDGKLDQKSVRIPPAIATTHMPDLANRFIELYGSLRPLWAKLYRTEFYFEHSAYTLDKPEWLVSGGDTFMVLRYLHKCRSFVSIDKVLHHYRIHESSFYNRNVSIYRVFECDYLFREAYDLLNDWNAVTPERTLFLNRVHAASVKDCILNAGRNVNAPYVDRLNVLQTITTNDLFCNYAISDVNKDMMFDIVGEAVKSVLSKLSEQDKAKAGSFYLVRLQRTLNEKNSKGKADFSAFLLSALCDPENKHLWGIDCLKKFKSFMPKGFNILIDLGLNAMSLLLKRPKLLRAIVNGDFEEAFSIIKTEEALSPGIRMIADGLRLFPMQYDKDKIEALKQELSTNVRNDNLEEAIPMLLSIMNERILDREGLYFKIYVAWQIEDVVLALDTVEIAAIFWNDDPDMMALCGDVFAAMGVAERAERFYRRTMEISNDETLKKDVLKRVAELECLPVTSGTGCN